MTPFDRATQLRLVTEARRAPSVHNIQPACWRFPAEGGIELWRDTRRALPVADPRDCDVMVSLGAAWEGMSLALNRRGLGFGDISFASFGDERFTRVTRAGVASAEATDPLLAAVFERATWRGKLLPVSAEDATKLVSTLTVEDGVHWLHGEAQMTELASLYDACAWEFMRRAEYYAELFAWMRLGQGHPDWSRDGLNAQVLALSRGERVLAQWIMRPRVMNLLARAGVAQALISEAPQIRSATAIAVLTRMPDETAFAAGRRFYRHWLELTAVGFALCPLSALTDSSRGQSELRQRCGLPVDTPLLNAWRVGKAPPGGVVPAPRLPAEELLLD